MGGAVQEDGARPLAEDVADVEASSSGSPSCNGRAVLQQPCSSNSNAHAHHHGHGSGRHGQDDTSGEDITTNGCPAATTTERVSSDKDTTTHVDGFSEQHPEEQHQLFLQQQSRPSSCVQPPTSSSGADAATATATGRGKAKLPRPETNEPCPRCSSEDTKFCYYNNYNIKQPRFFCKACQRYWTSGGTLRNVPPGSGRRKSKAAKDHDRSANSEHVVRQTNFPMSAPAPASNPASVSAAAAAAAYAANPLSALQQGPYSGSLNPLLADPMFAYNAAAAQQAQHQLLGGVAGLKLPGGMPVSANPWGPGDMNGCMYGPGLMGLDGNAAPSTSQQQQQQQRQAGDQGQEADEFGDTVESRRVRAKTETAGAAADAAQQGGQTLPGGCGGQADGHMSPSASPADGKHAAGAALSDQLNRQAHAMQTAWLQQAAAMQGAWQPGMAMMPGQAGGTAGGLPLDMQMLGGQQAMASALAASNAQQFQQLHAQGSAGAAAAVAAGVSPYQFNPYLFPSAAPGASAPGAQAWPYGGLGGAANMAGLLGGSNGQNPAMAAALVTQQLLQTRGGQASNASLNNFTGGGAAPGSWPLGAGAGASLPWGDGSMGLPHMGLPGMGMSMGMGMGMGMGMDPAAMGWACGMGPVMGSSGVLNGIEPTSCGAALANAGNAAGEGSGSPTAALGKHPRSADAAFTAT